MTWCILYHVKFGAISDPYMRDILGIYISDILGKHFSHDNVAMYKITSPDVNDISEYAISVI